MLSLRYKTTLAVASICELAASKQRHRKTKEQQKMGEIDVNFDFIPGARQH